MKVDVIQGSAQDRFHPNGQTRRHGQVALGRGAGPGRPGVVTQGRVGAQSGSLVAQDGQEYTGGRCTVPEDELDRAGHVGLLALDLGRLDVRCVRGRFWRASKIVL